MPGIKELKTRIKSIGSTRKITRAMQMVSAAKMRKAQNAVVNSRSYASLASEMIESLAPSVIARSATDEAISPEDRGEKKQIASSFAEASVDKSDALAMTKVYPNAKKIGVILLSSNRGLVGSLNTNLISKIKELDTSNRSDKTNMTYQSHETIAELITYGKRGQVIVARLKKDIVADFPKFDGTISIEAIYPITKFVSDAYNTGKYKKIVIVYNHFVSTLSQKPTVKQILPFINSDTNLRMASESTNDYESRLNPQPSTLNAIYEPSPQTVISQLIPRIIESQIYQTILESDASEHSARMVMMKNATEAAGDLISDLTLTYNQLRQNRITTELAEITAGKIALE